MDSKTFIAGLTVGGLLILLPVSWYFGKDGTLTAACFGLIGTIAGSFLGFHFGGINSSSDVPAGP